MATLETVLAETQRIGLIGPGDLDEAIAQARRFVASLPAGPLQVVDVGSGGGLPGLVIAVDRPDVALTMVDRRGRATDALRRALVALGIGSQARVVKTDVEAVARDPEWRASFDVATARGLGAPSMVAELVIPLLRPGGRLIVSALGEGERWPDEGLAWVGAHVVSRTNGFVVVEAGECPTRFPRARKRVALFDLPHP